MRQIAKRLFVVGLLLVVSTQVWSVRAGEPEGKTPEGKTPEGKTPEEKSALAILDGIKVDVTYDGLPLKEVLADIQKRSKVTITVDPAIDQTQPISLEVKEFTLKQVLQWVTRLADVECSEVKGGIHLHPAKQAGP